MRPSGGGRQRLVFHAPTRGLIGYQRRAVVRHPRHRRDEPAVPRVAPYKGEIAGRRTGVLISNTVGRGDRLLALLPAGPRPHDRSIRQTRVYEGMIVGEHTRDNDLDVKSPGQEAHQRSRRRQGRARDADAAACA